MSYHSESALKSINRRSYFPNACRISGYFDTNFIIIAQIEPILQKSKDTKIDNILNLEQVYFLVTRVIYEIYNAPKKKVSGIPVLQIKYWGFINLKVKECEI